MTYKKFGRVGVLAGGPSNEREISLKSGRAVYDALLQNGIDAVLLDVHDDIHDMIAGKEIDVAFIALHGRFGEDGTVQRILEEADIPYTGSDPVASRIALDKIASKEIFKKHNIPTPRYMVISHCEAAQAAEAILKKMDCFVAQCEGRNAPRNDGAMLPIVVKPQFEGSSIGLSIVRERTALRGALEAAFRYGANALIEEYIAGRELTVGILDDEPLPVIEIVPKDRVYDYKAKYSDPETQYLVPAPLEDAASESAKALGLRSYTALGCRSFSRVDMMMDKRGEIFVLEVNTIPGMTERSLLPKAAAYIGLNFGELCIKLIDDAIERAKHGKAKGI